MNSEENLIGKSTRGASYQVIGGIWQMGLRTGASVVLARVLAPQDFGIMGMVLLVTGLFSQVGFTGYVSAVIAKKEVGKDDLDTVFWMSVLTGIVLFCILFFSAPFFQDIFNGPQLAKGLRLGGLMLPLWALGTVATGLLSKNLRFGTLSLLAAGAVVVEMGLAIWFAVAGHGFWSLLWAWMSAEIMMLIGKLICAGWLPGVALCTKSYRFIMPYLASQFSNGFLVYLTMNGDRLVISWLLGPTSFGLYTFAIRLPSLIFTRIASPASGVIFPMLSKKKDLKGSPHLFKAYAKAARYLGLMSFPLLAGLAVLAQPLVLLLWGDQWEPIIVPMQFLCAAFAVSCVASSVSTLFLVEGRPDILPKISLFKLPLTYLFIIVGCLGWGLNGAAFGYLLRVTLIGLDFYVAKRVVTASFRYLFKQLLPPGLASLLCAVAAFYSMKAMQGLDIDLAITLLLSIMMGSLAFFATLALLFKPVVEEIRSMVKKVLAG